MPEAFGPAEFFIDFGGIERIGLPHFELVDGIGRDEIAADNPGLASIPGTRGFPGPAFA